MERVTRANSPDFVPAEERIAVFDNDGTLWAEQPYFQVQFALDRFKAIAPQHPEWKTQEPFSFLLREKSLMAVMAASHAGMSTEDFRATVKEWLRTAQHPKTGRPYTEMVYEPILERLKYLRANGFKTFLVSWDEALERSRPAARQPGRDGHQRHEIPGNRFPPPLTAISG